MAGFLFAFHGGATASTPEEGAALMAAWGAWMGGLGPALVDPGNYAEDSRTVQADGTVTDGGGANPVTGFMVVDADHMDAAVALTQGCPIFDAGGSVEVLELPSS